uniref:26S proteasome regulatory subunit RPN2 C-terminal domain-containing protein n=1 Tax=Glossina pallidipes TaxID=7398 RepID=A0A1A9Z7X7_GLOPL
MTSSQCSHIRKISIDLLVEDRFQLIEEDKDSPADKDKKDRKEPDPNFEILQNPARLVRQQFKVISVAENQTYKPLEDVTIGGIIVMQHTGKTDQELVEPVAAYGPKNDDLKEPESPEPFEYTED